VQTVDETQVLSVLKWKTAYYSFLNPLRVGAALAHADPAELAVLEGYCEHMGLAFQITDDILGTFGDEIQSGKSTQDDIKEGKITLLIARALKKADDRQRQALLQALGNDTLTQEEYEACKRVIEDTGALAYSQELAEQHAHQATAALGEVPKAWAEPNVAFLRALAQLIVNRSS
jgi:geranylgeranyl diphosphate synthase type I